MTNEQPTKAKTIKVQAMRRIKAAYLQALRKGKVNVSVVSRK